VRAREPEDEGFVERDGVKVHYEVHGDGPVSVVLLPTWSVVHARVWKAQVPYLSRRARVIVVEGGATVVRTGPMIRPPTPRKSSPLMRSRSWTR
jgi:hypothetical protein